MSTDELRDAIWDNNLVAVKSILAKDKYCTDFLPSWKEVTEEMIIERKTDVTLERYPFNLCTPCLSIMHHAVFNLYNSYRLGNDSFYTAIIICETLLKHGASVTVHAENVRIAKRHSAESTIANYMTPLDMLDNFRSMDWFTRTDWKDKRAIAVLCNSIRKKEIQEEKKLLDTVTIPRSLFVSLIKLRSGEGGDTLTFCCDDGKEVVAHPSILSVNSPY
jgi:hypothetical protein